MALLQSNINSWNKKSIVFIHGIGRQPENYSKPLYERLRKVDAETADASIWHEVAYDDVNTALQEKVIQFQGALEGSGKNALVSLGTDFLVDLINFLFAVDPYHWINTTTKKALVEVVEEGLKHDVHQREHEIYLISHSLGTVVAYETLHSILTDAQTLGRSSGFRVQTLFTLGSPIAFIKARQNVIPSVNEQFFLRNHLIGKPQRLNALTKRPETNVSEWMNLRQKFDPVASLTPLDAASSNGALTEDRSFDAFHTGTNPHDFANYLTEYGAFIMESIRG